LEARGRGSKPTCPKNIVAPLLSSKEKAVYAGIIFLVYNFGEILLKTTYYWVRVM
jgi:hypothetical protein